MKSPQQVLNELGIDYEVKGDNLIFTCTNPGHVDNHPSCSMDIDEGFYKCWGCGDTGNTYTLYKRLTGNKLDGGYNSSDYYNAQSYSNPKRLERKKKPKGSIELVEGEELSVFGNKNILTFLKDEMCVNEDLIYKFEIKYTRFSRYKSIYSPELNRDGSKFKGTASVNRIVIPIYNEKEELINMECRTYKGDTPKVLYVKDGISNTLFNIYNCDPSQPLVCTEGIKNLLKIHHVNDNVVSTFGAIWTDEKIQLLKDLGFKDIILFLDNDRAGLESANQFDEKWDLDFRVCMSDIEGEDPFDLKLREIKSKINKSEDYGTWIMKYLRGNEDIELSEYW